MTPVHRAAVPADRAEIMAIGYSFVVGGVAVPVGAALAYLSGLRGTALLVGVGLVAGVGVGTVVRTMAVSFARASGAGFLAFVQPSGSSSPYTSDFSQGLALEASDDIEGAIAWFEARTTSHPESAPSAAAFGDLLARHRHHARAEQMYLEARRLTTHAQQELYCTQRLIDLRLGPLAVPERAFPELRRIIDRFPGTREAEGARSALQRLKRETPAPRELH